MPVPVIYATVTATPFLVTTGCVPTAELSNIGRVVVVPLGIGWSNFTKTNPLKFLLNVKSELKLKVTSAVLTLTLVLAILGIPFLLLKKFIGLILAIYHLLKPKLRL